MGVSFDEQSARRIARAVRAYEHSSPHLLVPQGPASGSGGIVFGKLDASWKRDAADDETEATLSVYTPGWDDANFNLKVKPGNFHGYLYLGTWCVCVDDGTSWRIIYPMGYEIFGQFDTTATRGDKQNFSVYYHTLASPTVWTDTGDNILTSDITPVYNAAGASASTITSGKRCVAKLDPRGMLFAAGPLECN